jgi:hypothetical protein
MQNYSDVFGMHSSNDPPALSFLRKRSEITQSFGKGQGDEHEPKPEQSFI